MKKIFSNFGFNAYKVLGLKLYIIYIFCVIKNVKHILKNKNLISVDRAMTRHLSEAKFKLPFNNKYIKIDVKELDIKIKEDSYSFGLIRELLIRNCYFKFHNNLDFNNTKTVIDLGSNRGFFTIMCSSFADKIVSVEADDKYNEQFIANMNKNDFKNITIINKFIGGINNKENSKKIPQISLSELMFLNDIKVIDFLKIDIEGSEYDLFSKTEDSIFNKIKNISMELHPENGKNSTIIKKLKKNNFHVTLKDDSFNDVEEIEKGCFIYAQNLEWI